MWRQKWSHPTRGAWIEIKKLVEVENQTVQSHPTRGAWIEINVNIIKFGVCVSRTPPGVRGLK